MSAYVRVNRGGHFLDFDNGIRGSTTGNTPPMQVDRKLRGGLQVPERAVLRRHQRLLPRLHRPAVHADRRRTALRPAMPACIYGSESKGVNFIGALTPGETSASRWSPTIWMASTPTSTPASPFTNVVTGNGCAPIQGQQLQRQPKERYMLTPSYKLPLAMRRHRGVRHLHVRRRSHPGSVRSAAARHVRDLGLRHHCESGRPLAVRPARHQSERRARPDREQLAHLRRRRRIPAACCWRGRWRDARSISRRSISGSRAR